MAYIFVFMRNTYSGSQEYLQNERALQMPQKVRAELGYVKAHFLHIVKRFSFVLDYIMKPVQFWYNVLLID